MSSSSDPPRHRAFIDTNVLAKIISGDPTRSSTLMALRDAALEPVTYVKCIYELYSLVKGTTKSGERKRNHPLKHLLPAGLNDIAQRLFRRCDEIDVQMNAHFWFSLCEEWRERDYFGEQIAAIEQFVRPSEREQAEAFLQMQREWLAWKHAVDGVLVEIDARVEHAGVLVLDHWNVFATPPTGLDYGSDVRELARNTLLPNEDFDLVLAAIRIGARVYVTEDCRLMMRGGASLGLNGPSLSFCHPSRLADAAADEFAYRFYAADPSPAA